MLTLDALKTDTADIRTYIAQQWDALLRNARNGHHDTRQTLYALAANSVDGHLDDQIREKPYILYLPNDFISPGGRFVVQFYWDSYFILQSLLLRGKIALAKGIVENCLYLVQTYGMVIANRKRWAAGSQLPFLSAMVKDMYQHSGDMGWLRNTVPTIEHEYSNYWNDDTHRTPCGLNRYHAPPCFPKDCIPWITMDNEATFDLSPRFDIDDVLELVPVDLNANLYMYEQNFEYFYTLLGDSRQAEMWRGRGQARRDLINTLCWDEADGIYYDYCFTTGTRKVVKSLVTFFPLFYSISTSEQAERVRSNLHFFEVPYGLVTCDHDYDYKDRQWNHPVGWAPLHWIAYHGLKNYGYHVDARRIALKWLSLNAMSWKETGKLYEKYDVVRGTHHVLSDRYENQEGFGWTNAVFDTLVADLLASA